MANDEVKYLTVSALNRYMAYKIDTDVALRIIYIKGEVSNARISKGHMYFVLKDEESEINAIIFSNSLKNSNYIPTDGSKVLITGSVTSYQKKGTYNLIVSKISEYGQGLIYQRFLELKNKLSERGLFDESHKLLIPKFPKTIGVISSSTADGLADILSTINKRYPITKVLIYPALVQGVDAPMSLIKAIKKANHDNIADVIIIARGGGSIEDLNCFNDELLANAIYESKIPIVSGVGHETDYTICDFVADLRAPTPTGAAVLCTPDKELLINDLMNYQKNINDKINKKINDCNNELLMVKNNYYFKSFSKVIDDKISNINHYIDKLKTLSPINTINQYNKELNNFIERFKSFNIMNRIDNTIKEIENKTNYLTNAYNHYLQLQDKLFTNSLDKLVLVNPLNIMKKGYALVYKDNNLIVSSKELNESCDITINFHDGLVHAKTK